MPKPDKDSEQSITLFPLEQPATLPVITKGTVGDPEKPDASKDKRGSGPAETYRAFARSQQPTRKHHVQLSQLSPAERARLARGVGALQDEGENQTVIHPTCRYWPPKGLPQGLYRDTVLEKTKNFYQYHVLATVRWILMISQIILGAILTALGSLSSTAGTPITLLAALNTVDAGLLALMHNSGIPERYRSNRIEFSKVEDAIKEILDTGIVEWQQSVDEVLLDLFDKYQCAKASVNANMPSSYVSQQSQRQKATFPDSGATSASLASQVAPVVAAAPHQI